MGEHVFRKNGRQKLQKFLSEVLPEQWDALSTLYPSRESIVLDGKSRRELLYCPKFFINPTTGKLDGTKPHAYGDAYFEFKYLEGVFKKYDWDKIATWCKGPKFPERTPPFPVRVFPPVELISDRVFSRIEVWSRAWFRLDRYDKSIPWACWHLYLAEIPYRHWRDTIVTLIHHDVRLRRLMRLIELDRESTIISEPLWSRLRGPKRRYVREANKYIRPTVQDLIDQLTAKLESEVTNHEEYYSDEEPLREWVRNTNPRSNAAGRGIRVNASAINRLVDDLIRSFCSEKLFSGLDIRPDWVRPFTWNDFEEVPKDIKERIKHLSRRFRDRRGKRIREITE